MSVSAVGVCPGPHSLAWIRERVAFHQLRDRLAPVTVVVPNHYVGLWLRRELAQTGYANVRFDVLARLGERLGAGLLATRGLSPLTSVAEDAAIRAAIATVADRFGAATQHAALVDTLRDLFRTLREREVESDTLVMWRDGNRMADAALSAFAEYEGLLERHRLYDDRVGLDAATERARALPAYGLRDTGSVLVYLPARLLPAAARLISAIGESAVVEVALAVTGDAQADEEAWANREALGVDLQASDGSRATQRHITITPDAGEEVRSVCRKILADLDAGIPLNRIAILWRMREPYAALVRETLTAAGLPLAALEGRPLAESVVARGLLGLLELRESELARLAVLEWRSILPHAGSGQPSFATWNRLARDARIVRGAAQWRDRLARLALEHRKTAAAEERSDGQRAYAERQAAAAEAIAAYVSSLADATEPPAERTWPAYVAWARELRRRFVAPHRDEDERDAAAQVDEVIEGLGAAGPLGAAVDLGVFRHALEAALRGRRRPQGKIGVGVVIGSILAARGIVFDRVHIVGMVEGAFPSRAPADPIFPDSDPLETGSRRTVEERAGFIAALASADGGVARLSAPSWDADLRPAYAAAWLLEVAETLAGERIRAARLRGASSSAWLDRIPSPDAALASAHAPLALSERRVIEARLWAARGALTQSAVARRADLPLARGLELRRALSSSELTEFDGNVSAAASSSERLRRGISSTPVSSSAVERWCECPFHYYLERVLYVDPTERPEDDESWTILPAARGTLVHGILERFFAELLGSGRPSGSERYGPDDRMRLESIATHEFAGLEATGRTGYALAWENERRAILRDLHTVLTKDEELRSAMWLPAYFEQQFGGVDPSSWPAPRVRLPSGAEVRLRGFIDRVDVAPDRVRPERARLMDYKTGSIDAKAIEKDPLVAGTHVQPAVYALAVWDRLRALGAPEPEIEAGYWQIAARHRFRYTQVPVGGAHESLRRVLAAVDDGVTRGAFPLVPGAETMRPDRTTWENCAWCDYDRVCPVGRGQAAERKAGDPLVALHQRLTEQT